MTRRHFTAGIVVRHSLPPRISAGGVIEMTAMLREVRTAESSFAPPRSTDTRVDSAPPHVVIVGAGFGGLAAARALRKASVRVTVIDRHNYHLFQPLLYQVATAGLSPADIAAPIRSILARQTNATVRLGRVTGIDVERRVVQVDGCAIGYDHLVVATGARHAYFGHDDWESVAPGLKKIEDATAIRREVLAAFERAENCDEPAERRRLLNFVIIGAGPTGVELAGAIAELAKKALAAEFRNIDPTQARIVLVEAGSRVLPAFPEALSAYAKAALGTLGVEVRLGHPVTECDRDGVVVAGERIPARTIVWAAGVAASPAAKWLGAEKDRAGRVKVLPDLTLPGHPEVSVVGDTAVCLDEAGRPVPGIAPAAKQQGAYAAAAILARIAGGNRSLPPFRYRHLGNLATIGRKVAVCDFGVIKLRGRLAWLLWGAIHIFFLIGFRNRAAVLLDWLWAYVTFRRGSRLITGDMM
jgi:NADH dehydrogenase FAD-containing subunit